MAGKNRADINTKAGQVKKIKKTPLKKSPYKAKSGQAESTTGFFKDVLNHLEVGVYITQKGKFVYVNPLFADISGYDADFLTGKDPADFIYPKDKGKTRKHALNTLKGQRTKPYEYRFVKKNGEIIWVTEKVSSIKYNGRRAVLGSFMDITKSKHMGDNLRESEDKFRNIIDSMQEEFFEADLAGNFTFVNDSLCRSLGYPPEKLTGMNFKKFIEESNVKKLLELFNNLFKTGEPFTSLDMKAVSKNGTKLIYETSVSLIRNARGEPVGFRGLARDVTDRKKMEQTLKQSEERYRTIIEQIDDGYFECDRRGHITFVNDEECRILGYTREELIGMTIKQLADEKTSGALIGLFADLYKTGKPIKTYTVEVIKKNAARIFNEISASVMKNSQGEPVGFRGIVRDITERRRAEEQIEYLATHDNLTGLPNRVMFNQLLNQAIQTAKRYSRQFAVLFVDLDRFKIINDTLGHHAGDQLILELSVRFRLVLRAVDVVARFAGDEFVIMIEEINSRAQAATVAQKILAEAMKPVHIKSQECRVTASIGISIYPKDGEDEQSLMKNADIAMYFAKEQGKNNFQFFSRDIKTLTIEKLSIETDLRFALERGELSLVYQAKVDFKSGRINGVEALLRWKNPAFGEVTPTLFIPVAEETGLIVPIGRWVLQSACRQNIAWQKQGLPPVCIAVNLSLRQLMDDKLIDDIKNALNDSGMAPGLLELELTESMVMHNPERMTAVLTAIKDLGVHLAIDDFGTGYSSLAQIKHFPVDTLKVDRSFIRNLPEDTEDKAITEAIIAMAKTLCLTIVAEGVETEEQMDFLRHCSCDEMQGFYFSRPLPPEGFAELLSVHDPGSMKNK